MHQKQPPANVAFASSARTTECVKATTRPASSRRRDRPEARSLMAHSFVARRRGLRGHAVPDPARGGTMQRCSPRNPGRSGTTDRCNRSRSSTNPVPVRGGAMRGHLRAGLMLFAAFTGVEHTAAATEFAVDPEVGNNAFTAVFDSQIGERITAVSSAIGCTLTIDEAAREGHASCSVPLSTVRIDNDDTKTEHFGQWATNKKTDPKQCTFRVEVPVVTLPSPVEPKTPVAFTTEGRFTICGRPRDDGQAEHIQGTVIYLPA